MRSQIYHGRMTALVLAWALGLTIAFKPVRAARITSMQIVAVIKNQFPEIVWPWPTTAVRIITVDANEQRKVADAVVDGDAAGVQFSLSSCLIKPPALACAPSASTMPCCTLASSTTPTEIYLLADRVVPPGHYMLYFPQRPKSLAASSQRSSATTSTASSVIAALTDRGWLVFQRSYITSIPSSTLSRRSRSGAWAGT
jgi:hypothetical protein